MITTNNPNNRGLTLVGLLVLISIIGILGFITKSFLTKAPSQKQQALAAITEQLYSDSIKYTDPNPRPPKKGRFDYLTSAYLVVRGTKYNLCKDKPKLNKNEQYNCTPRPITKQEYTFNVRSGKEINPDRFTHDDWDVTIKGVQEETYETFRRQTQAYKNHKQNTSFLREGDIRKKRNCIQTTKTTNKH